MKTLTQKTQRKLTAESLRDLSSHKLKEASRVS